MTAVFATISSRVILACAIANICQQTLVNICAAIRYVGISCKAFRALATIAKMHRPIPMGNVEASAVKTAASIHIPVLHAHSHRTG